VLLTNYYDWDFIPGMNELWHELQNFVILDHAPNAPAEPAIPADTLHPYVGYYELRNSRQQLVAWLDRMLNGTFISLRDGALFQKDFVGKQRRPLIPVTEQTFRSPAEPDASKIFFQTPEGRWVYYDGDNYYEKSAAWKPWSYIIIFLVAWVLMLSTIPYAIVWIPMHLYKRITKKENRCKYLRPRIVPLLAVMALLFGFISVSNQSLLEFGQKSSANMQFFISTLLFATLSLFALFLAIRSFWKPVKPLARAYALLVSLSCVGMTIFFYSWGIIGLRLWVY